MRRVSRILICGLALAMTLCFVPVAFAGCGTMLDLIVEKVFLTQIDGVKYAVGFDAPVFGPCPAGAVYVLSEDNEKWTFEYRTDDVFVYIEGLRFIPANGKLLYAPVVGDIVLQPVTPKASERTLDEVVQKFFFMELEMPDLDKREDVLNDFLEGMFGPAPAPSNPAYNQ